MELLKLIKEKKRSTFKFIWFNIKKLLFDFLIFKKFRTFFLQNILPNWLNN